MDGAQPANAEKRRSIGLVNDVLPAVGFNLFDGVIYPYDESKENTYEGIQKFVVDFLTNNLKPGTNKSIKQLNRELEEKYSDTPGLSIHEIDDKVLSDGNDVLLLIYDSKNETSLNIASNYNRVARRFKELKIYSLKVYRIDARVEPVQTKFGTYALPSILFLPAFHKKKPFLQFTGEGRTVQLMFFAQKYADIKFELPELPHLTPEQVPAYWEQVKELDEEKRKKAAAANERRDWGDYF